MTRQCTHCQKDIENAPEETLDVPLIFCSVQCRQLYYVNHPESIERGFFPTIFGARRTKSWTTFAPRAAINGA